MKKEAKKFYYFIGMSFLMYALIFFPEKGSEITVIQILIDAAKSILIGFVIVYVSEWIWKYGNSKTTESE
jgi:hypothetical protein